MTEISPRGLYIKAMLISGPEADNLASVLKAADTRSQEQTLGLG